MSGLSSVWERRNGMSMTLSEWARKNNVAAPGNTASALMRGSLYGARNLKPEQIARDETLAERLSMPSGAVALDREAAEREAAALELEQSPQLTEWAGKDEANAAFAREDRDGLLGVWDSVTGFLDRETDALSGAWDLGGMQVRYAGLGNRLFDDETALRDVEAFRAGMREAQQAQEDGEAWVSSIGLTDAVTQLPQMGETVLPSATEALGMGATVWGGMTLAGGGAGAAAGSVVPGLGTAAGGLTGSALAQGAAVTAGKTAATATYLARMAQRSFYLERGTFMADIAQEKDLDGRPLPREVQKAAATLYGGLSALVDTGGEALFLRLLRPLGLTEKVGQEGVKSFLKSAVRRAAFDRRTQGVLLDFAGRMSLNALSEGTQEGLQELAAILVEEGAKDLAEAQGTNLFEDKELLSEENTSRITESVKGGAVAGAWFFAVPGGIRIPLDLRDAQRARQFSEAHKTLADRVAATKTRELSPARMESFLQTAGLDGNVLIPADAAWELQQKGIDLAGPLGWDMADMEEAAALGHDIVMPVARLQARLQPEAMKAVADIMREGPQTGSAADAANLNENLPADMDGLIEQAEDDALERSAIEGELERLHDELTAAVTSSPHLMAQITSTMDGDTSVGQYVDTQLGLIVRRARQLTRMGIPMSDTLSRFSFQGLVKDENGRMVTPEEAEALAQRNAEEEALAPFWDEVWGRLNPDSLRTDFPDARRELAYRHGRGLFARKGQGVAVDELADELKNRGLLEADADSSTLIERLKDLPRPSRRGTSRRRLRQAGNPLADRFADMPMIEADSTQWFGEGKTIDADSRNMRKAIQEWAKTQFPQGTTVANSNTGWEVQVTPSGIKSSLHHGYDELLARSMPFIPQSIEGGIHVDSIRKTPQLLSHIFANKIRLDGQDYVVGFVLREDVNGNRFYDHELTEIINPDWLKPGHPSNEGPSGEGSSGHRTNRGDVMNILRERLGVNDGTGRVLFQTAWHGTPHKFDEFSLDAIGTGEGAQAHGWGLYFAADKKVSDDYRNRLRKGRSRGQLFEVDIPEDDVLLDEQKIFAEQPEAVRSALRTIYKSFSKEQLAPVREEMKAQVRRDKDLEKRGEELTKKRQRLFNQRRALKTVNAQRPKGEGNPFSKEGSAKLFDLGEKYLHEMYSNAQIERLQNDAGYLNAEKAAVEKKIAELEQKIAENEQRIETKRAKERESIDKARLDTLLSRMNGSDLYSGISIVLDSPKAASEALNAAGIKGITYDGQQDGRSFVVFDDKAIQVLNTFYQGQTETPPEAKLAEDVRAWSETVDGLTKKPREPQCMLSQTPLVFHLLGADFREVYAAPHVFDGMFPGEAKKGHNAHPNTDADILKQLPAALADPIAVFGSDTVDGRLVFMVDVTDANGATVVLPVQLDARVGSNKANIHIVTSAYSKENGGVPNNRWFETQAGNLLYVNRKKEAQWVDAAGSNSLWSVSTALGKTNILTEADLGKLKNQYPGYYQTVSSALGSTTPDADGHYVIQLFRGANLSTLAHETAHVFFLEMERLEREGLADARMLADLAALREWTADFDDDILLKEEYDRYQKHQVYGGADFEALPGFVKESVRNRAKQERLARGFEQYLREGKAPSKRLEGVFGRFRKWLMRVYRDALALRVELTDEVRDVFDRMLAHESEMDLRAEAANVREETARLLDALELKGARRLEMEGLITAARDEAAERLRHARDAGREKRLRAWMQEAREEVEREQVYMARKAMRRTPIDLASFNDVNGEELGRELVRKLPGAARRAGGVEPEVFAAEHGYASAAAMARDIIESPTPGQRIKQLVDERQAEHDALFDADEYLFDQEQLAEQQERIAEALAEKIRHITAKERYRREVEGKTLGGEEVRPAAEDYEDFGPLARWRAGRDQLAAQARAVLQKKPLGEAILPEQFRRAAGRWMQEERRAILKGDFEKAMQANYRARINIELARQAAERREQVEKLSKRAKRFVEMDRADSDARFAVFVLSQNTGLFPPTRKMLANAGDKGPDNVEAFARKMREAGFMGAEDAFDGKLFATGGAWKGMTWEAFRPYAETMTMIMHMERESRTAQTAQGRVDMQELAEAIAESIRDNNRHQEPGALAKRNGALELLKQFHAAHLKADTIAMLLDGDTMGPAWRAIIQPINEATWNRAERLKRERDTLKKLFSVYSRRELVEMKGKRFRVPSLPDAITKEQALGVLLNCGNAGNRRRLMDGQSLTEEQLREIIDTLDERDVRFAQSVWDYFETFRKESFDLEESLTGVRPEAVEATPVQTRFGTLRGGYYPVVYDRGLSARPVDTEKIGTQTSGMFPSVSHGSMKQRTETGLGTPLSLSLDVIPSHVAETVHMLAFRRPVLEVAKLLRRREVNGAIQETAGVATAKALDDWLHYVAGERPASNGWDRAAAWARKNAALYTMGFRLSTILAQTTGLFTTVAEIGPRWALRGVTDTYGRGNPLEVWRTVMDLSPMMRNRITSIDREIFEVSSRLADTGSGSRLLDPFVRMKSWMERYGFMPMGWVQMFLADLPTWNGAYAKALQENGGDVKEAVLYADAVVERTQVGGAEKDLAGIQRGRELGKLMTMFYSYFSALYNLSARRITMLNRRRDAESVWRLGTLALLTWFAEPVLMGLLKGGPDEEEPDAEDWISWGAKEAFFNPFNMVIGVREAASMVDSYVSGYGGRYRLSSALDVFDSAMRFGAQVGKTIEGEGDGKKLALTGGKAIGQATGFINAQEMQLLEIFWNWLDGTTPELELGNLIRKKK